MSNTNTGMQWDEPFGWAPTNWIAVAGLEAYGFRADAARIAQHFDATVDAGFAADGTIREKYNVVSGNSNVKVSAGYNANEIGFGWTNAVYLKMKQDYRKRTGTELAATDNVESHAGPQIRKGASIANGSAPSSLFLALNYSGSASVPFTLKLPVSTSRRYSAVRRPPNGIVALGHNRLSGFRHHAHVARLQFKPHLLRGASLQMNPLEAPQRPERRARNLREVEIKLRNLIARLACRYWSQ